MERESFGAQLSALRQKAEFTNQQLADRAGIPRSLIAGLQSGRRRIGERQALRLGGALGLEGEALDTFIMDAVNTCSVKVLKQANEYPSFILNLFAKQLKSAGIKPNNLSNFQINGNASTQEVKFYLADGRIAQLSSTLQFA